MQNVELTFIIIAVNISSDFAWLWLQLNSGLKNYPVGIFP
jgi:hypothetical protein